jgi:hypothetical protein
MPLYYYTFLLCLDDYLTLAEGEEINDNIVDFVITYLQTETLPQKDRVFVFRNASLLPLSH